MGALPLKKTHEVSKHRLKNDHTSQMIIQGASIFFTLKYKNIYKQETDNQHET